VGVEKGSPLK